MGEVGCAFAVRIGTQYGVAHRAGAAQKHLLATLLQRAARRIGRLPLARNPIRILLWRARDHEQGHLRMLISAEFGALAAVDAGRIGTKGRGDGMSRNEVLLAVQIGYPEAV